MNVFGFQTIYTNFSEILEDIDRIRAYYKQNQLVVGFDIYPESMKVVYKVTDAQTR